MSGHAAPKATHEHRRRMTDDVERLVRLIAADSHNPGGDERALAARLADELRARGPDSVEEVEGDREGAPGRGADVLARWGAPRRTGDAERLVRARAADARSPGGDERALAGRLADELRARGPDSVEVVEVDREGAPGRGAYVLARWGEPRRLVNAHLDTVPPNAGWT